MAPPASAAALLALCALAALRGASAARLYLDGSADAPGSLWDVGPPAWTRPREQADNASAAVEPPWKAPRLSPKKSTLRILTWNVENLGKQASFRHQVYVRGTLMEYVKKHTPDVMLLQEVEGCSFVRDVVHEYDCVDTVVDPALEERTPMVLGSVMLYDPAAFDSSEANSMKYEARRNYRDAAARQDLSGRTLYQHHRDLCSWDAYNQCNVPTADMPKVSSVKLALKPEVWEEDLRTQFPGAIRFVNVHLFAGGRVSGLSDQARADRRAFQMRSLMALMDYWNNQDGMSAPPSTIYAGDFNTRGADELGKVVSCAKDWEVQPWCPANGGPCATEESKHRTHNRGFLDNVVVDLRSPADDANVDLAWGGALGAAVTALRMPEGAPGALPDHSPLLVELGLREH